MNFDFQQHLIRDTNYLYSPHKLILMLALLQVWQLGSERPNFTLKAHEKGVNCVRYYSGGDKPYLITGGDDHLVKIWDYQVQRCHCDKKHMVHSQHLNELLFPSEQNMHPDPGGPRQQHQLRLLSSATANHPHRIRRRWVSRLPV